MKKDAIVLYPALDRGHLFSMIELANFIATHHPSLSITLLLLTPPTPSTTTLKQSLSGAAAPSITFLHLPPLSLPSDINPNILSIELCRRSNHNLRQLLLSISKTSNIKAIVLDFMNFTSATTVTNELNLPTYFYYTSGASSLCTMLHFPTLHETTSRSLKDLHMQIQVPGIPRISGDDYPEVTKDRESSIYHVFLEIAKTMRDKNAGIIVNTFDAIEERAIRALTSKEEVNKAPALFCIGPLISNTCENDEHGCLSWLDSQPSQSVVLLSFGSLGRFSKKQLKEIAVGLEKSKQRFLWVVRAVTESDNSEPSLDELLPEGFLERTKEKGMVVRDWAPQVAILSHDSVGGFVTHCGWNSVLEGVCEGVPMVAWPLYAEQKINRVVMVHEMKIALGVKEDKDGFVSATELGERVSELMDSERGKEIRQRIFKMRISAVEAKAEGGSSLVALNRLVQLWKSTT